MRSSPVMMQPMPLSPMVKKLIIINVGIWLLVQLILGQFVFSDFPLSTYIGLVPAMVIGEFAFWQIFTYMFLHSMDIFHILFNMLLLWMIGSEIEQKWGSRFFLIYYLTCGIGAGLIYTLGYLGYAIFTGKLGGALVPVVGASGAVFGLLLAYGMVFGDRVIYFMFMFPMKARYFVMILGGVEVLMILTGGQRGVANLAHLGGLITGFVFLWIWARRKRLGGPKARRPRGGPKLHIVVENEKPDDDSGSRYWN